MSNNQADIAVIGGSGLYEMDALTNVERVDVDTPFGNPSDSIVLGRSRKCEDGLLAKAWARTSLQPHSYSSASKYLRT